MEIGGGSVQQGVFADIDWANGPYFLKTETDPNGGSSYTVTSTQQLLSVPYALYAKEAGNGFSGDYNDLSNVPQIPQIPADISAFNNDAGYITDYTESDPQFNAWDKDYNDLINKPTIPTIPTDVSAFNNDAGYITMDSVPAIPTNVSAFTNDAGYLTSYTETDPQFNAWDKDYNDLINLPQIPQVPTDVSAFNNDAGYITMDSVPAIPTNVSTFTNDVGYLTGYTETDPQFNAWDKDYNDLINKPTIPTVPTDVSAFNNDAGYITMDSVPAIPTNVSAFTNDAGYLTSYTETDPEFNAWDKDYNDLINKPNIPTIPDNVSSFNNDVGYITMDSVPAIPTDVSAFTNDAGYLTGYTESQSLADVTAIGNSAGSRQLKEVSDPTESYDAVNLRTLAMMMDSLRAEFQQELQQQQEQMLQQQEQLQQQIDSLGYVIDAMRADTTGTIITYVVTVSVEGGTTLCEGASATLYAIVTPANANCSYQWYKDNVPVSGAMNNNLVVTAAGSYKVVVSINGFTTESNTVVMTANPIPAPTVVISHYDICNESDALTQTLTATRPNDDGSTTCAWFLNGDMVYTGDAYPVNLTDIKPTTNVDKTVTFTIKAYNEESNCYSTASSSVTITFHQSPEYYITYFDEICPGSESVDFTMQVVSSQTEAPYTVLQTSDFDADRTDVLNSSYSLLMSNYSGPYTKIMDFECGNTYHLYYTVTDANGCVASETATFMAYDSEDPIVAPATWTTTLNQCNFEGENVPEVITTMTGFAGMTFVTDNCGIDHFTYKDTTYVPETSTCENVLMRTYTFYDYCNNTSTFTQIFVAHDSTPPTFVSSPYEPFLVRLEPKLGINCTFNSLSKAEFVSAFIGKVEDNCAEYDSAYLYEHAEFYWGNSTNFGHTVAYDSLDIFRNLVGNQRTVEAVVWDGCGNVADTLAFWFERPDELPVPVYEVIPNHNTEAPYDGIIRLNGVPRGYIYELFSDMNLLEALETQIPAFDAEVSDTNVIFDELEGDVAYTVKITSEYGCEVQFVVFVPNEIGGGAVVDGQPCPCTPTVTDYDGNVYNTVQIGNQCWMKQNLRTTHYADGTTISSGGSATSYTNPYYYNYSNSSIALSERGYLYNWPAAMHGAASSSANPSGVQGVCPMGWHLPSDAEWTQLTDYVSGQTEYTCLGNTSSIASALASTTGWYNYNVTNTCAVSINQSVKNATGFSAVPAGYCYGSSFYYAGYRANFWSATQRVSGLYSAYGRDLYYNSADVCQITYDKDYGRSVRCLRD